MLDYVGVSGVEVPLAAPFFVRAPAGDDLLDRKVHSSAIVHFEGDLDSLKRGDSITGPTRSHCVDYLGPAAPVYICTDLRHSVNGLAIGQPQRELLDECLFQVGVRDAQFRILQQKLILRHICECIFAHGVCLVGLTVVLCYQQHIL